MTPLTTVCFDIGGVANVRDLDAAVRCGQERWGETFTSRSLRTITKAKTPERDYWREFQNGSFTIEHYLLTALTLAGLPSSLEDQTHLQLCLELWCGVVYDPIMSLNKSLQQRGYRTAVLSNNNPLMYAVPSADLARDVDVAISSHEIGVSKPDARAYCILLERLGNPQPSSVLFIDDKIQNIIGAETVGLRGFHFRSKDRGMDAAFAELKGYLQQEKIIEE